MRAEQRQNGWSSSLNSDARMRALAPTHSHIHSTRLRTRTLAHTHARTCPLLWQVGQKVESFMMESATQLYDLVDDPANDHHALPGHQVNRDHHAKVLWALHYRRVFLPTL